LEHVGGEHGATDEPPSHTGLDGRGGDNQLVEVFEDVDRLAV